MSEAPKKVDNRYLKFTDLGFRMLGFIIVGLLVGQWLDKKLATTKPYATLILVLLCIIGSLYTVIKETSKKEDN
jgi:F0F1-type ATP synthase assembly protein I